MPTWRTAVSDLKVRTLILDELDKARAAMTASDLSLAVRVPAERVKAALAALVGTREVLARQVSVNGTRRVTTVYCTDVLTEVAS